MGRAHPSGSVQFDAEHHRTIGQAHSHSTGPNWIEPFPTDQTQPYPRGPGKVAKRPTCCAGALVRRHTRAACHLRPRPPRPMVRTGQISTLPGPWPKESVLLDFKRAFPFTVYGRRRPGTTAPSTAVPCVFDTEEVTGSNPVAPTTPGLTSGNAARSFLRTAAEAKRALTVWDAVYGCGSPTEVAGRSHQDVCCSGPSCRSCARPRYRSESALLHVRDQPRSGWLAALLPVRRAGQAVTEPRALRLGDA
jgi:hypothetical protein